MKNFKLIKTLVGSLGFSLALVGTSFAQTPQGLSDEETALAESASDDLIRKVAAKTVLFSTLATMQSGEIVEVSPKVRARYRSWLKSTVAPIPIGIGGAVTAYLSQGSLEGSAAQFFKAIAKAIGQSFEASWRVIDNPAFEWSSDTSFRAWDAVWTAIRPMVGSSFNKQVGISFVTLGVGGSVSLSIWLVKNSPESAMSHETVRSLIGYNKEFDGRLDALIDSLSDVYSIPAEDRQKLKDSVKVQLMEQAVATDFSDETTYEIDVLQLMFDEGIIDESTFEVSKGLDRVVREARGDDMTPAAAINLRQNLETMATFAAVVEQQLQNGNLEGENETLAKALLYDVRRSFEIVQGNFSN